MNNKNLLMLTHRIPYPPNKGEKIRSFNQMKFLAENGWNIHLCTHSDDPEELKYEKDLAPYCKTVNLCFFSKIRKWWGMGQGLAAGKPMSAGYFYSRALQKKVNELLAGYPINTIFCCSSPMAEYVFNADHKNNRNINRVMDLIDVDSLKWKQYASQQRGPVSFVYWLESKLLSKYEAMIVKSFDAVTLVTQNEVDALLDTVPRCGNVYPVGNGVDLQFFKRKGQVPNNFGRQISLAFFGRMDYYPNEDAVIWFAKKVLPLIRKHIDVRFCIVGSEPSREVLSLSKDPGIEVTGEVDDIRPYVWESDICVFPIRVARGIQNKVLEAMAMAKPIVASLDAFEGLKAVPGKDLLAVETVPEAFADAILSISETPGLASDLAGNAYDRVHEIYSWNNSMRLLKQLL